jgi:hypothetical protein
MAMDACVLFGKVAGGDQVCKAWATAEKESMMQHRLGAFLGGCASEQTAFA